MVVARLLVERGSYQDKSQDWGEHKFLGVPSPGDRITISRDGKPNYLTVLCAHHSPAPAAADIEPSANIVAKWTGEG